MSRVVSLRLLTLGLVAFGHAVAADEYAVPWGRIDAAAPGTGRYLFVVERPPSDRRLAIPRGFPQVTRAVAVATDLPVEYDSDGAAFLVLQSATQSQAAIETGEDSRQFDDGRIVLTARDARVTGAKAKLESQPGNHRIGFWTNPHDDVSWDWKPTRWGAYEARLTFANASPAGRAISVAVGNTTLGARLESTGSWYRYTTLPLGRVVIPTTATLPVTVRCTEPAGGAVMNLKALTLTPACEGATPRQSGDRSITLHGRDATVRGTMLRWEPTEKKQTLGFWTRASDAAEWTFGVDVPGTFDVEVLQGCGSGQGGSEMGIVLDPQTPAAADIAFTVEDTGGFQEFRRRTVGRVTIGSAGEHLLRVQPRRIAKQAACDIREIRLVPASG